MAEYIEREAAIEKVRQQRRQITTWDDFTEGLNEGAEMALGAIKSVPSADVAPVVRCRNCKKRNKKKCPLVMVRFDMKTNGTIKEILEQNYVDEDFWCKDGERKGDDATD